MHLRYQVGREIARSLWSGWCCGHFGCICVAGFRRSPPDFPAKLTTALHGPARSM